MNNSSLQAAISTNHMGVRETHTTVYGSYETVVEESLPFTVRLVRSQTELDKAIQVRHAAYARHVPELAEKLKHPESLDVEPGVVVLLAESKVDGSPLGTMRIQTNQHMPLTLEQSIELPGWLKHHPLAEATRLGVAQDRIGRLVKTALFKSFYQYCKTNGIEWMVIAGRSPLDRQYERLMFEDVYPDMGYIPLRHANNMPHRIMAFEVDSAEKKWRTAHHPLYNFVFQTYHPDLDNEMGFQTASWGQTPVSSEIHAQPLA
jgi:hypothetical protein